MSMAYFVFASEKQWTLIRGFLQYTTLKLTLVRILYQISM